MKPIKNVIWPKDEIVLSKKHIFNHAEYQTVGNTMEYIDNAIPFYRLKEYNEDEQVYINMCINISKTLKEVHEAGILLPDFNFSNILVDKNLEYYFSDFDSASLDGTIGAISSLSAYYLRKKGILIPDKAIEEYDKISLIMQFAGILLEDNILSVKEYNYDKKTRNIMLNFLPYTTRACSAFAPRRLRFIPLLCPKFLLHPSGLWC